MVTVFAVVQIRLCFVVEMEALLNRLIAGRESFVNVFGIRFLFWISG